MLLAAEEASTLLNVTVGLYNLIWSFYALQLWIKWEFCWYKTLEPSLPFCAITENKKVKGPFHCLLILSPTVDFGKKQCGKSLGSFDWELIQNVTSFSPGTKLIYSCVWLSQWAISIALLRQINDGKVRLVSISPAVICKKITGNQGTKKRRNRPNLPIFVRIMWQTSFLKWTLQW